MSIVQIDDDDGTQYAVIQHISGHKVALEKFSMQMCKGAHLADCTRQLLSGKECDAMFVIPGRKATAATVFEQTPASANSVITLQQQQKINK